MTFHPRDGAKASASIKTSLARALPARARQPRMRSSPLRQVAGVESGKPSVPA
ncbi:MAG: hypothetical protein ACOYD3_10975 [Kiritimatiellia bacterium]